MNRWTMTTPTRTRVPWNICHLPIFWANTYFPNCFLAQLCIDVLFFCCQIFRVAIVVCEAQSSERFTNRRSCCEVEGENLSMMVLMLEAEVQRQWRKKGMRVTIIRIVMSLPPKIFIVSRFQIWYFSFNLFQDWISPRVAGVVAPYPMVVKMVLT